MPGWLAAGAEWAVLGATRQTAGRVAVCCCWLVGSRHRNSSAPFCGERRVASGERGVQESCDERRWRDRMSCITCYTSYCSHLATSLSDLRTNVSAFGPGTARRPACMASLSKQRIVYSPSVDDAYNPDIPLARPNKSIETLLFRGTVMPLRDAQMEERELAR